MERAANRRIRTFLAAAGWAASLINPQVAGAGPNAAYRHLNGEMDRFHRTFDVFTDLNAAGNHFAARCGMAGAGGGIGDLAFDEASTDRCHSGANCISFAFTPRGRDAWSGWYFQNGILTGDERIPACNWGDVPEAGFNLKGAAALEFWARGEKGGERVDIFVGGVGWDPVTGAQTADKPDSLRRVPRLGHTFTFGKGWRKYRIDLSGRDLSYVNGGFGIVVVGEKALRFWIDDVRFRKRTLDEPRWLVSYVTLPAVQEANFDTILRNVGFLYDNVVVLLAYLARGRPDDLLRARLLADAIVYAQEHDRYYGDWRLRNTYQGGDHTTPPAWEVNGKAATARLPGWWSPEKEQWLESQDQVGTSTGNVAWAMIGLLRAHRVLGTPKYLASAERLAEWVVANVRDELGGFTGGFEGWEPTPYKVGWKSTEHNLDLYVAFMTLADATGKSQWRGEGLHAKAFVRAMWGGCGENHFATGTQEDGVTPNCAFAPTDVNTWGLMVLGEAETFGAGADWVLDNARVEDPGCFRMGVASGVDFNGGPEPDGMEPDGIWWEGTAHTALALQMLGRAAESAELLSNLRRAQQQAPNRNRRGLVAACRDGVSTGIEGFAFFNRLHIAATAWYSLAELGINPFWGVPIAAKVPHEEE